MRRILAPLLVVALALASGAATRADEDEDAAKEALRRRLLEAYRAQARVLHAFRFEIVSEGVRRVLRTELYVQGDSAGIRMREKGTGGDDALLMTTDGVVCVARHPGEPILVTEGARTLRKLAESYAALRREIASELGISIPEREPISVQLGLNLIEEEGGPELRAAVLLGEGDAPGWLHREYWKQVQPELHEAEGFVLLRSRLYTGRLALGNGMPLEWDGRNPKTGGTAKGKALEPTLSPQDWDRIIDRECRDVGLDEVNASMRREGLVGPYPLLYDLMKHVPDLARDQARQAAVAKRVAEFERGWIAAEDAEHLRAKASRIADEMRETVRQHAAHMEWSEAEAEAFADALASALVPGD